MERVLCGRFENRQRNLPCLTQLLYMTDPIEANLKPVTDATEDNINKLSSPNIVNYRISVKYLQVIACVFNDFTIHSW